MQMEELYDGIRDKYIKLVKKLISSNAILITAKRHLIFKNSIPFKRNRVIIPFVPSAVKSNFMAITPLNIFTKEDPILRYVPTLQSAQLSSITWFEGTVFGSKPLDSDDTVDLIFIRALEAQGKKAKAVGFIESRLGKSSSVPMKSRKEPVNADFRTLFCSVCLVFCCRLHAPHNPNVQKCNEKRGCICPKKTSPGSLSDRPPLYKELLQKLSLKSCVISRIMNLKLGIDIACARLDKKQPRIKKIISSKYRSDARQFYEPCDHNWECNDQRCACERNQTPCEAFCGCISCSSAVFCSCKGCDKECPCRLADRECSDLCGCSAKHGSEFCSNMPVAQGLTRMTSVGKSQRHGLGLFAEEFISSNSYVIEYTGELITDKEAERRGNFYEMNKLSYLFNAAMRGNDCLYSIDAFSIGNKSRFINHSVSGANIESKILVSHGNVKVVFYSLRDIFKGEELLFDYKFTDDHKKRHGIQD